MTSPFKNTPKRYVSVPSPLVIGTSSSKASTRIYRSERLHRSYELVIKPKSPTKTMSPTKRMTPKASDTTFNINTTIPAHGENVHGIKPSQSNKSPRNDYFSSPSTKNLRFHTPTRKISASPHTSSGDRFIPNRSQMRVDLCRSSMFSSEKKRLEFMDKKVKEYTNNNDLDTDNDSTNIDATNISNEILTPIQTEYRARMRGALLSLPVDTRNNSDSILNSSTNSRVRGRDVNSITSHSVADVTVPTFSSWNERSNLAYANVPDLESENIAPSKFLSFSGNLTDGTFSSLSSEQNITPSKSKFIDRYELNKASWTMPPDPLCHNHLRVLDRSTRENITSALNSFDNDGASAASKVTRRINTAPTRILDAPELVDDYYLNLISWGADNILAVALGQCVYLWNAASGDINHLLTLSGAEDFVTSVKWAETTGNTKYLAVGTNDGPVQLWDTEAMRKVRSLGGHTARVGSLDWNQHWLSSGGRDSIIIQHDVRSDQHIVSTFAGHTQEVCGLAWSEDGGTLASGGNENYLCIWDAAISSRQNNNPRRNDNRHPPRLTLTQHVAAVKALAWCPFHRGLLASGGGTADRTIKFWNSNSGAVLNSIDTGSQVCSLLWSKHQRELCSSHGFSENQLILWRYPTMSKIQEFKGHTARVSFIRHFLLRKTQCFIILH